MTPIRRNHPGIPEMFACLPRWVGAKVTSTMKRFFLRGLWLGAALVTISIQGRIEGAETTNAAGATLPPPSMLAHDELTQLNKARETVFAAHPELKAENEKLKAMHDATTTPTADQRNAAFAEWKDYQKKMRAEMLKVDPTLQPIFAKIDAARKNGSPAPFQPAR